MKKIIYKILLFYIISMAHILISSFIFSPNNEPDNFLSNLSNLEALILYTIGSFIETFLFSFLIILGLKEIPLLKDKHTLVISIIAGIPFGLAHWYNLEAIFITFITGILFNIFYLDIYKITQQYRQAILYTSLLHFMLNFSSHLIEEYLLK